MPARWTRFERFLIAGLVVTGVAYLAQTVWRSVDRSLDDLPDTSRVAPERFPSQEWTLHEGTLPPPEFFVEDRFVGEIEGPVVGFPFGGREVLVEDESGRTRVVDLRGRSDWKIYRRRNPERSSPVVWRVAMARGAVREVRGIPLSEDAESIVVRLESGVVTLPRQSLR